MLNYILIKTKADAYLRQFNTLYGIFIAKVLHENTRIDALGKQHGIWGNLTRTRFKKCERGEYDDGAVNADLVPEDTMRVAAPLRTAKRRASLW